MAKVHLRKYTSEIDNLIEAGQTDEAIAHCLNILKTFPKHIETYRLLGKAYLEARRYDEATDIFRRIINAVPDDFISHVGLSIIADEQNRLQDAIWHMERAFEKQPSNAAIQAELQRLYGRRDGREPPRIRLTRGALAYMYYQGELYPQAINEIRAVLAEDPERVDMLSLLALAHFRAGQKVEASEICARLLARSPYHFDANRILTEILPGTGMAESAEEYRRRVIELDPYAAYASSVFKTDEVPSQSVTLERLEYQEPSGEVAPSWSMPTLAPAETGTEPPDWLKTSLETESAPLTDSLLQTFEAVPTPPEPVAPTPIESTPPTEDAIPEWMRAAGWGPATGTFDEAAFTRSQISDEEPVEGELTKADLPDWIKAMAPSEEESIAPTDLPDWLKTLAPTEPEPPSAPPAGPADVPDWLKGIMEPDIAARDLSRAEEHLPKAAEPSTSLPWETFSPSMPPAEAPSAAIPLQTQEPFQKEFDRYPGYTQEPAGPATPSHPEPAGIDLSRLGTSADEQDAALRWLESLAAKQGASPEELITDPSARLERPPEWVAQFMTTEPPPVTPPPTALPASPPPAIQPEAALQEEAQEPPLEQALGHPGYTQESAAEALASSDWSSQFESPIPTAAQTPETPQAEFTWSGANLDEWLKTLDQEEPSPPAAAPPQAEEPYEWSREIELVPRAGPGPQPSADTEIPAWLREVEEPTSKTPPSAETFEELPEWLRGEEPETPPPPPPARPTDWTPEIPSLSPQPTAKPAKAQAPRPPAHTAESAPQPEAKPRATAERARPRGANILQPPLDSILAAARESLQRGKIPDALQLYSNLIRKGKFLDEITFDLKEALYRFPVEVSIWQTLGDAYMRANRLQDALDAYTKAEELLR